MAGDRNNPQHAHGDDSYVQAQNLLAGHTNYDAIADQAGEIAPFSDANDDTPPLTLLEREYLSQLGRNGHSISHISDPKQSVGEFKTRQKHEAQVRQVISALKNARLRHNMTIAQVAEIAGVDKSVISRFENETTDTRLSTLLRYADAVEIDVSVSVGGVCVSSPPTTTIIDAVSYVIISYIGETVWDAKGNHRDENYAHSLATQLVDEYHTARQSTEWFNEVLAGLLPAKATFTTRIRHAIANELGDTIQDHHKITLNDYAYSLAPYVVAEMLRYHNNNAT